MSQTTIPATVARVFDSYPVEARRKLLSIRQLIIDTAATHDIKDLSETLKWQQPSYLCKTGSTIRLGWSAKTPHQCGLYVHCQSRLIDTFKVLYPTDFLYEGNRAILFSLQPPTQLPIEALSHCISMALQYQHLKKQPLLGN